MSLLSFWNSDWKKYEAEVKEAYQMGFADGRLCPQGRPCEIDGRPAVFHRWVDEDSVKVQLNTMLRRDDALHTVDDFKFHGFLPATASPVVLRVTFALVEYDDGTVCKIEPEKVKFTDRRAGE